MFLTCFPGMTMSPMNRSVVVKFLGAGEDDVTVAVDAFEPAFEDTGVGYGDS